MKMHSFERESSRNNRTRQHIYWVMNCRSAQNELSIFTERRCTVTDREIQARLGGRCLAQRGSDSANFL